MAPDPSNVVTLFQPRRPLHRTRSREQVLTVLVPKLLSILWNCGQRNVFGRVIATLDDAGLEIGGLRYHVGCFDLHVYAAPGLITCCKVFSAHVADRPFAAPGYFPYCDGRCGLLSWKRGPWEDQVMAQPDPPRTFAHLQTAGLTRRPP